MYQFRILDLTGENIFELEWSRIRFREELNTPLDGSIEIPFPVIKRFANTLKTDVMSITSSGIRFWQLYWKKQLVKEGIVTHQSIMGGSTGATSLILNLTDFLGALAFRYTDAFVFRQNTDSSDIAWEQIDYAQNQPFGDLGITRGLNPETIDRQRTMRHRKILELITSMSREKIATGFDFDIDLQRAFNVHYPEKGSTREDIVFNADWNVLSWGSNLPLAGKISNRVHVLGEGQGDDLASTIVDDFTDAQNWLLWESVEQQKTTTDLDDLIERGQRTLERNRLPQHTINLMARDSNPNFTDYDLGDRVAVRIDEIGFAGLLRVRSRAFQILPSGEANIDVTFQERVIDDNIDES